MAGSSAFRKAWDGMTPKDRSYEMELDQLIGEVADANQKEFEAKNNKVESTDENPKGSATIARMINRIRGIKPKKEEKGRQPANLESETLRRLHAKVRKD